MGWGWGCGHETYYLLGALEAPGGDGESMMCGGHIRCSYILTAALKAGVFLMLILQMRQ